MISPQKSVSSALDRADGLASNPVERNPTLKNSGFIVTDCVIYKINYVDHDGVSSLKTLIVPSV